MKKLPLVGSRVYEEFLRLSRDKNYAGGFDITCPITKDRYAKWPCNAYAVVYESFAEFERMQIYANEQQKLLQTVLPMAERIDEIIASSGEFMGDLGIKETIEKSIKMQIKLARAKEIDNAETVGYRVVGQNKVKPTENVFSIEIFKNGQRVLLGFSTTAELASQIGFSAMTCDEMMAGVLVRNDKLVGVDALTRFDTITQTNENSDLRD